MNSQRIEECVKMDSMVSDYDYQSDILYLHKELGYQYKESVEMGDNIILDLDIKDIPVAVEILDASKVFLMSINIL